MSPKAKKGKNSITPHLRPVARPRSPTPPESPPPRSLPPKTMDVTSIRNELLSALRLDVAAMFKAELREALAETLSSIKTELLAFKTELSSSLSAVRQDVASLKSTVSDVELSLSTCTDDIVALRAKVEHLTQEAAKMEDKCDDLESRSRRQNIRIIGIPEDDPNSASAANVSKLLMEAFSLVKEPLIDRSHRALAPKPAPGNRPRAIVARLHYYNDCNEILRKARELQRITLRNMSISVFPDYTPKTARARAAFTEVRHLLRGIDGVRFGILFPARLRITYAGVQRDFTSPEEAKTFIKTLNK